MGLYKHKDEREREREMAASRGGGGEGYEEKDALRDAGIDTRVIMSDVINAVRKMKENNDSERMYGVCVRERERETLYVCVEKGWR